MSRQENAGGDDQTPASLKSVRLSRSARLLGRPGRIRAGMSAELTGGARDQFSRWLTGNGTDRQLKGGGQVIRE